MEGDFIIHTLYRSGGGRGGGKGAWQGAHFRAAARRIGVTNTNSTRRSALRLVACSFTLFPAPPLRYSPNARRNAALTNDS